MKTYTKTIAKPYLCFAAILEGIIKDLANIEIDQIQIANYFGVSVPLNYSKVVIGLENIKKDPKPINWGINIDGEELANFFSIHNLSIYETYFSISNFADYEFDLKIIDLLNRNSIITIGFDYGFLFNKVPSNVGHISRIINYQKISHNLFLTLYDPGPDGVGEKVFNSFEVYQAIHFKKSGLSIFSSFDNISA